MHIKKFLLTSVLIFVILNTSSCGGVYNTATSTINIAVTYKDIGYVFPQHLVEHIETTTNTKLEFTYIPNDYTKEYLRVLFSSDDTDIDAVFFSNKNTITEAELLEFNANSTIAPLNNFITSSQYFSQKINTFEDYDVLKTITSTDGNIYYMPALDYSNIVTPQQIMWINSEWLKALNLEIPTDTASFEEVLLAFKEYNPQGAPLLGSTENESNFPLNFIVNSFTVCNPSNYYFSLENGKITYPPTTKEWRDALIYLNKLYEQGLILDENFSYNLSQFTSAFNAKESLVGLFTSYSIDDVAIENSPELWTNYLAVYPLSNGDATAQFVPLTFLPTVGGVILENSQHKEKVFEIMDLLYTDIAYMYSHYGIEGEDWKFSQDGEITATNEFATVTVFSQNAQNREVDIYDIAGPFIANPYYTDNVAWIGFQVKQSEHSQIRLTLQYQNFMKENNLSTAVFHENLKTSMPSFEALALYVKNNMIAFTNGELDINSDNDWRDYLDGFDAYALQEQIELINNYV